MFHTCLPWSAWKTCPRNCWQNNLLPILCNQELFLVLQLEVRPVLLNQLKMQPEFLANMIVHLCSSTPSQCQNWLTCIAGCWQFDKHTHFTPAVCEGLKVYRIFFWMLQWVQHNKCFVCIFVWCITYHLSVMAGLLIYLQFIWVWLLWTALVTLSGIV